MKQCLVREMTITRRDFLRLLPKALRGYPFRQTESTVSVPCGGGHIFIVLSEERTRRIAGLCLPVVDVTFRIEDVAEAAKDNFFKVFDRAYQRGGG